MEYKILIPSYHRHERQDTLDLLSSDVFRRDDIIISTQEASDYTMYAERYGERATVIYKKGNSVGDNRNTLLEWCQENRVKRAVMLDDDIRAFRTYDGAKITQPLQIEKMLSQCFSLAEKHGATIFGAYMVDNTFFMKNTVSVNKLLIGTVLGFTDTSLRFDPQFRIKEDFELCLRLISKGRRVLRFNSLIPTHVRCERISTKCRWLTTCVGCGTTRRRDNLPINCSRGYYDLTEKMKKVISFTSTKRNKLISGRRRTYQSRT